jgi:hypothetical protein
MNRCGFVVHIFAGRGAGFVRAWTRHTRHPRSDGESEAHVAVVRMVAKRVAQARLGPPHALGAVLPCNPPSAPVGPSKGSYWPTDDEPHEGHESALPHSGRGVCLSRCVDTSRYA